MMAKHDTDLNKAECYNYWNNLILYCYNPLPEQYLTFPYVLAYILPSVCPLKQQFIWVTFHGVGQISNKILVGDSHFFVPLLSLHILQADHSYRFNGL